MIHSLFTYHMHVFILKNYENSDMKSALTNVGEQIVKESNDFLTKHGFGPLSDEKARLIVTQVSDVLQPDHRIRSIVRKYFARTTCTL